MYKFRKTALMLCISAAVMFCCIACGEKDDVKPSAHKFTEKQQEVLEILHGKWQENTVENSTMDFIQQFDTNVVVYKYSDEYGQEEDYQYQGVVVLNNTTTYYYYVTEDAEYLYLYDPQRGVLMNAPVLDVVGPTHFRLLYNTYNMIWLDFYKL